VPLNSGEHNVSRWLANAKEADAQRLDSAHENLVKRYKPEIVAKLRQRFRSGFGAMVDADSAADAAFAAFFENPPKRVSDRGAFWGYIYRAAENRLRNQIRDGQAKKRRPSSPMPALVHDAQAVAHLDAEQLLKQPKRKAPRLRRKSQVGGKRGPADSFFKRSTAGLLLMGPLRKVVNQSLPRLVLTAREMLEWLKEECSARGTPELYEVVVLAAEGQEIAPIARKMGYTERTVVRKLDLAFQLCSKFVYD
jgi:DNA-directed RNA polymerase specialized sigma24 family protein